MLPSPDILNDYEHGKFVLSNLAAKRAQQLRDGAPVLVNIASTHPLTIALAEIAAGKIRPRMTGEMEVLEPQEETAVLVGEDRPAELGILLPAVEDDLDALEALEEEEALLDEETSLTDIMDETDEVDVVQSEEDTLSLDDLAAEEDGAIDAETAEE